MKNNQKILLTISMLASNRIETLRKSLDSLKPIMEKIPSELILTDTSKDPEIHNILLEYTDHVVEFDWCNDFSKARNVGLKLAKGEWFMFLDDDEWFVEIDELVKFFMTGEYKKYGCANYIQRNFYDMGFENYSDSWVSRIIKRDPDTHFKSKIHEYLYPVKGDCKYLSAMVHHSGYIFSTLEKREKHFDRNATLLLEMIEEEPENLRWQVQLAQEYRSVRRWEELYTFSEKCIEKAKDRNSKYDNYDIGTFYGGGIESLLFLKRYDEGIEFAERAFADKRNSPMCHAYIYLALSAIYFGMQNWKMAEDNAHRYLKLSKEIQKDPVKMAEQKTALLVGEALDGVPTKRAYSILIGSGLKQGDTAPLRKYLKKLEWNKKVVYAFDGLISPLIEGMAKLPLEPAFIEIAQLAWNNSELQKKLLVKVQEWENKDKKEYCRLLRVLSNLEGNSWYLLYAKVVIANEDNNQEETFKHLQAYYENSENIFVEPSSITEIVQKTNFPLEDCLLGLPFEKWTEHISDYLSKVNRTDIFVVEHKISAMKMQENIRYDYFYMRVAEALMLFTVMDNTYEEKRKWIKNFIEKATAFHKEYYSTEAIEEYPEILPEYAQAAFCLEEAFVWEDSEPKKFLEHLKMAVDVYQNIADVIKSFIKLYGEARAERERKAKAELRQLEKQIKQEVYKCLERKNYTQALSILRELKKMKPEDLEVVELTLKTRIAMLETEERG